MNMDDEGMHLGSREGQDSTDAHRVGRGASQGAAGPGDQGRRDTSAGGAGAAASSQPVRG